MRCWRAAFAGPGQSSGLRPKVFLHVQRLTRETVVFHDRKRHGSAGNTFVLLTRFEEHCLARRELQGLTAVPGDLQLPADDHQQLGPRRRVSPDLPAWIQQCGDYVGGPTASQDRGLGLIARRVDWVVDGDTVGAERVEQDGLHLDHLHSTMLGHRIISTKRHS